MTPEDRIVSDLADVVCKRIARQTRMALTKLTDCRLSGDDSMLKNSWEEICVQAHQQDRSVVWDDSYGANHPARCSQNVNVRHE